MYQGWCCTSKEGSDNIPCEKGKTASNRQHKYVIEVIRTKSERREWTLNLLFNWCRNKVEVIYFSNDYLWATLAASLFQNKCLSLAERQVQCCNLLGKINWYHLQFHFHCRFDQLKLIGTLLCPSLNNQPQSVDGKQHTMHLLYNTWTWFQFHVNFLKLEQRRWWHLCHLWSRSYVRST